MPQEPPKVIDGKPLPPPNGKGVKNRRVKLSACCRRQKPTEEGTSAGYLLVQKENETFRIILTSFEQNNELALQNVQTAIESIYKNIK